MKNIEKITITAEKEFYINLNEFYSLIKSAYKKNGALFLRGYIERTIIRTGKKESVDFIFENNQTVFISYGSAILGLEDLIEKHPNKTLLQVCIFLNKKFEETQKPPYNFEIKKGHTVPIFNTKNGGIMVNVKEVARVTEIENKSEFKDAMIDSKAENYDKIRFDDFSGEFIEPNNALEVLNLCKAYLGEKSKNEKLNYMINQIRFRNGSFE